MDTLVQLVAHLIGSTENLAKLGAIGAWVFFTLVLLMDKVWTQRAQRQASESAWEARMEEAKQDGLGVQAMNRMAEKIQEVNSSVEDLSEQVKELKYKIKCGGSDA